MESKSKVDENIKTVQTLKLSQKQKRALKDIEEAKSSSSVDRFINMGDELHKINGSPYSI